MSKGKIFVTGGNGFIGSRLVHALLENDYEVRCLLRSTSKTDRIAGLNYEKFIGDITDQTSLEKGLEGCVGMMHLAGLSNWDDIHSPKMEAVVVEGSKNCLKAANKANVKMVYVSSSTAINGTETPDILDENSDFTLNKKIYSYAFAKKRVEKECIDAAKNGQDVVIVNPAEVYGPNDYDQVTAATLIDFIESKPTMVCNGGTSIVHVDDVASGIMLAYEKGKKGERYFLGGENLTFSEIAAVALKLAKRDNKIMLLPNKIISFVAKVGGALKIPLPFNPAVIPYAVKYWFVKNDKAKNELGVTFRNAEETLRPTIEWLEKEKLI
ncbi:MAG: NAD-dependent epimerase/dehydratase family protein [Flavobacteriales bacterium]|nr:NAD-dependent epimerase/dehydratase family protein [Flavobacteriales bacterium]